MTSSREVTQALVAAGYLSDADIEAALVVTGVITDIWVVSEED